MTPATHNDVAFWAAIVVSWLSTTPLVSLGAAVFACALLVIDIVHDKRRVKNG